MPIHIISGISNYFICIYNGGSFFAKILLKIKQYSPSNGKFLSKKLNKNSQIKIKTINPFN